MSPHEPPSTKGPSGKARESTAQVRDNLARAVYESHSDRQADEHPCPWPDLPENDRAPYRRRAADIEEKLALIGAALAPLTDPPGRSPAMEFAFTPEELDLLSRHEHERWMREKLEAGWTFGPTVDPEARTHPCLVSYDSLPKDEKEKDREQVERIPRVALAAGLSIRGTRLVPRQRGSTP